MHNPNPESRNPHQSHISIRRQQQTCQPQGKPHHCLGICQLQQNLLVPTICWSRFTSSSPRLSRSSQSSTTFTMADRWAHEFNGEDDEDEALRLAIAMSLGKEPAKKETPKKQPVMVDLTQNEIDLTQDDIETASEASSPGLPSVQAQAAEKVKPVVQKTEAIGQKNEPSMGGEQSSAGPASVSEPAPVSSLSALGLDRAKMEEERLARIRKRKAAAEGHSGETDSKRIRTNDENRPLATAGTQNLQKSVQQQSRQVGVQFGSQAEKNAKVLPSRLASSSAQMAANPIAVRTPTNSSQQPNTTLKKEHSSLPFPKGVVKKTWVKGQPRLGDDIRLEEVLQKDELELALISSYQWDQDWMFEKFDLRKTKLVLVAMGGDEAELSQYLLVLSGRPVTAVCTRIPCPVAASSHVPYCIPNET
ncbi:hypothetical protein CONLIGDRAFT_169827 [Coniochaeta ligniaria NRRL 30616]|uniref:Uncharacterized protein n=1 Tax=Coniochaeta ligniaria NRRL 30616 TaxID=1408157 RepID=A0A1J7J1R9_9PEZI|nr:hypothetical protein CONLIGDRAFT_169827 [Coniochaeta ligniaria NRRL 30616]